MTPPRARPAAWSLAARLTTWYAASAFGLVLVATMLLDVALARTLDHEADLRLAEAVAELRRLIRQRPGDAEALRQEVERSGEKLHLRVTDDRGRVVAETSRPGPRLTTLPALGTSPPLAPPRAGTAVTDEAGRRWRLVSARAAPPGDATWGLLAALDVSEEAVLLRGGRERLALVLAAALGACALVGRWLTRSGLSPLAEMTATAARIDPARLAERVPLSGLPRELLALGEALNATLDRLEQVLARLSQFSQDIAHELRTPIQNLKGEIEVCLGRPRQPEDYRQVLDSCLEEADRLARLIDRLLFLARSERPEAQAAREPQDVDELLASVRDFYEPQASEAGVAIELSAPAGLTAALDAGLARAALSNLLENALRHTPPGGRVTLSARRSTDGALELEVADTGEGIPPEHLPHVFDRFYRVDPARSGGGRNVGLGLSIVRSIVRLHGGEVRCASEVGRGTCMTLVLPAPGTDPSPSRRLARAVKPAGPDVQVSTVSAVDAPPGAP